MPLMADSRFCFSENPRVSAAKMGARPSGSTTTNSVTKALNANSIRGNFASQRRTFVGDDTPLARKSVPVPWCSPRSGLSPPRNDRAPSSVSACITCDTSAGRSPMLSRPELQSQETVDMLQYGPDLIRFRDQNKGFEARGPARDPLCEPPACLTLPRAAGAHGVSPGTELARDLAALLPRPRLGAALRR